MGGARHVALGCQAAVARALARWSVLLSAPGDGRCWGLQQVVNPKRLTRECRAREHKIARGQRGKGLTRECLARGHKIARERGAGPQDSCVLDSSWCRSEPGWYLVRDSRFVSNQGGELRGEIHLGALGVALDSRGVVRGKVRAGIDHGAVGFACACWCSQRDTDFWLGSYRYLCGAIPC